MFISGNPKTRKPETGIRNRNQKPETGIRNLESTNQRKQVLQVRENYLAKLLPVKNKRPSKKPLKLKLFWNRNFSSVKIHISVILSAREGYDYGDLNKVRRNMIPSTLRASKIIIALTTNNRCTNFNRRKFLFQKRLSLRGFFVWTVTPKYFMVFVFPFSLVFKDSLMMPFCGYFLRICFPTYGKWSKESYYPLY